jgi:hypothetical protein
MTRTDNDTTGVVLIDVLPTGLASKIFLYNFYVYRQRNVRGKAK